nr:hypothetical protein [Actinomycetota bacterium]
MQGELEEAGKILGGKGPRSPGMVRAAQVIQEKMSGIIEDYGRLLEEMGSLLIIGEGNTREQVESQARGVLERTTSVLKGEERSLLAVEEEIYRN